MHQEDDKEIQTNIQKDLSLPSTSGIQSRSSSSSSLSSSSSIYVDAEEYPMTEEFSVIEENPLVEENPMAEENPMIEENPMVEETSMTEENPMVEENPVVNENPIVKENFKIEEDLTDSQEVKCEVFHKDNQYECARRMEQILREHNYFRRRMEINKNRRTPRRLAFLIAKYKINKMFALEERRYTS